ncbi:MAG: CCE_0567 family metalloprotein [Leptolyngbyaceae bacterium]|nr:CCE_0567 family metalloprotein [Leptolyngbyaceae bacterium]
MVQTSETTVSKTSSLEAEKAELTKEIRKLNSKAGQMKMDLHDIAEGLPVDLEKLPEVAERTYTIFCQLRDLKADLKALE